MLSIGAMGSGQGQYYLGLAQEDYYVAGGEPPGHWYGSGSAPLGLTGLVAGDALKALFDGFSPATGLPLAQNAGATDRQPGWDLTFSAPKSVSVLWSQADLATRQQIQAAQAAAVRAALDYLEDTAAFTRRGRGGTYRERAKLIVALFEHGTSRAQDPQLHTHCLVMNACARSDGTTGTILSKPLYEHKMSAGAIYRAEFAHQLERRLSLSVRRSGSCFELAGVAQPLIDEFSHRRAQIVEAMADRGYASPEAAAAAALATREIKGHVAREALFSQWQQIGEAHGWGPLAAGALVKNATVPTRRPQREMGQALAIATTRATEQQSYFAERDYVRYIAEEAQGRGASAAEVRAAATSQLRSGKDIVWLGEHRNEGVYTTREMQALEKALLVRIDGSRSRHSQGVWAPKPAGDPGVAPGLSSEQKAAIVHACGTGAGTIRIVTGMAGTGKTTMLAAARNLWVAAGFDVHGASLSGRAAKELSAGARIDSDTLHRTLLLIEHGRLRLSAKSVLVVDEAGMVGTRLMDRLVRAVEQSGARLVCVGDARQLQPIEAGGPFAEMARRLGSAALTEIRRQRDEWARRAVHDFADGEARRGLDEYARRGLLTVSGSRTDACAALVDAWREHGIRSPREQLIFAGTRSDAAVLNRMAQRVRAEAGALGSGAAKVPHSGETLHVGDRVIFTRRSRVHGIENGSLGEVTWVDGSHSLISARLDSGERVSVSLSEYSHVRLGYAVTTHKGQGATVERSFVLVGGPMQDREITYVQASRSRGETHLFTDRESAGERLSRLARKMTESRAKVLAHNIASSRPGPAPEQGLANSAAHGIDPASTEPAPDHGLGLDF